MTRSAFSGSLHPVKTTDINTAIINIPCFIATILIKPMQDKKIGTILVARINL